MRVWILSVVFAFAFTLSASSSAHPLGDYRSGAVRMSLTLHAQAFTVRWGAATRADEARAALLAHGSHPIRIVATSPAHRLILAEVDVPAARSTLLASVAQDPRFDFALPAVKTVDGMARGLTHQLLVATDPTVEARDLSPAVRAWGGKIEARLPWRGGWLVRFEVPTVATLFGCAADVRMISGVEDAHPNFMLKHQKRAWVNDPYFSDQWQLHNTGQGGAVDQDMDVPEAWDMTWGDPAVIIAVIDDGFRMDHEEWSAPGKIAPGQYDFWDGDADPSPADVDTHGTPVAGIAVATANNGVGMAGICPSCRLLPLRQGYTEYDHIKAFERAADFGAHVVNNSWGITYPSWDVEKAIKNTILHGRGGLGTLVIFAAGNDDVDVSSIGDISAIEGVFTVSATDSYGNATGYTNYGTAVDAAAPVDGNWGVTTTAVGWLGGDWFGDYTSGFGGTSAAAPMVAGVAGLVFSVNTKFTSQDVFDVLVETAHKITYEYNAQGKNIYLGHGQVNAADAVTLAFEKTPGSKPNPTPPEDPPEPAPPSDSCADFISCWNDCASGDMACWEVCKLAASPSAVSAFHALKLCITISGCYEGPPSELDACANAACEAEMGVCYGWWGPPTFTEAPTCVGSCGARSMGGCFCDTSCADYGDCCPDMGPVCGKTPVDDPPEDPPSDPPQGDPPTDDVPEDVPEDDPPSPPAPPQDPPSDEEPPDNPRTTEPTPSPPAGGIGTPCEHDLACDVGVCAFGRCRTPCTVGFGPCASADYHCQRLTTWGADGVCVPAGALAPGSPCTADAQCTWRLCEAVKDVGRICVLPCRPNGNLCPDTARCMPLTEQSEIGVCRKDTDVVSGCSARGGRSEAWFLVLALWVFWRRRRVRTGRA